VESRAVNLDMSYGVKLSVGATYVTLPKEPTWSTCDHICENVGDCFVL